MKAERRLRKNLEKMQNTIFEYHYGNRNTLELAQHHGRQMIMAAVQRNEILPVIAEGLKVRVDNWGY